MDTNQNGSSSGVVEFNSKKLLDLLRITGKKYDLEKIQKAYEYAASLHEGQFRASGEPYISHPLAVAEIVAGLELDTDSICAALLHDTVEDCADKTDLKEVQKLFGDDVALLVDGLTKLVSLEIEDKEEQHIETFVRCSLLWQRTSALSLSSFAIDFIICVRLMRRQSIRED